VKGVTSDNLKIAALKTPFVPVNKFPTELKRPKEAKK